jgi:hypothetical protein
MNDLSVYNAVKDRMKTGDLLQWHSNTPLGWAIRAKTGSRFNHSGLVIRLAEYEGLERRRFTHEALEHGVVLNLVSRRLEDFNGEVWWYPLKDDWKSRLQEIGERALGFTGIGYDYPAIAMQLFTHVQADCAQLFCSEMCFLAYGFSGVAPNPGELLTLGIFQDGVQILACPPAVCPPPPLQEIDR